MKLAGDEPRMSRQFDDFHQAVGGQPGEHQPAVFKPLHIGVVEFIAVAVAFADDIAVENAVVSRALFEVDVLRAEPHRAAQVGVFVAQLDAPVVVHPFGDERNHRVGRIARELGAVGAR